jgi:hypothetical protein
MNDVQDQPSRFAPTDETSCPFLGFLSDQETSFGFPDPANRCHRLEPAADIALDYQQDWCLSANYKLCRVFQNPSKDNLPEGVTLHYPRFKLSQNFLLAIFVIAFLVALLAALFLVRRFLFTAGYAGVEPGTLTAIAVPVSEAGSSGIPTRIVRSETPTLTATPTLTPFPTSTLTPQPSMTFSPEPPTPGPGLETPFGPGSEIVLHKVQAGESARSIAYDYRTTYQVITSTNVLLPGGSVLIDSILVIIPGMKENLGLPVFHPLYLDSDGSLRAIAELYAVLPDDLRRFNSLGPEDRIPAGRWIIIPLQTPTSP